MANQNKKDIIHVVSVNTQGLKNSSKRARLHEWIKQQKCSIVLIQETHFTADMDILLKQEFCQWTVINSYGNNTSRGCSTLILNSLNHEILNYNIDTSGRFVIINLQVDKCIYTIINVYAPNDQRLRNIFFNSIGNLIKEVALGLIILGGDQNQILESRDRYSKSNNTNPKNTNLHKLIKTLNLIDIWREINKSKTQFTWKRRNNSEKSRIDFWLIDSNLRPAIHSTDIRPAQIRFTDHMAISLKINKLLKSGPGYWKLNNSFLTDRDYINMINSTIDICLEQNKYANAQVLWDLCKICIKENSIKFSINKSKERRNIIQNLENRLKYLYETNDESYCNEISRLESQIEEIYSYKAMGAQIRSRTEIVETNNNFKLFSGLEKSRQTRKILHSLNVNGEQINETSQILKHEEMFYKRLYSSDNINTEKIDSYLSNTQFDKTLSTDEALSCDGPLTLEEGKVVVSELKKNRSPGSSGLTAEFYQTFWNKINKLVINSLNHRFDKGELPHIQKTGILTLLFKKGDPQNLENWRPISLLNIDYKIATRILAKRIQNILPKIINLDQQGYIKNRNISFNIRQIQDVIDYSQNLNIDGAILFLDFRKAYDTVDRTFLFSVMEKFKFNAPFISWIKTFYNNSFSYITNNGWRSNPVMLQRGLRQGCPISSLMFTLVAEIMALNIRNNTQINGISVKLSNSIKQLKITQLADDTTIFLGAKHEVETALQIIETFGKHSGLQLNRNKTKGLWIGKLKNCTDQIGQIHWSKNPIKALGVYFSLDNQKSLELNWGEKIKTCENIIRKWLKRNLTFFGKIKVIKTFIMSKFVYLAQSIVVPKHIIKHIDSLIYNFLWHGKREKIKRTTLIGQKEHGGIEMCDTYTFFNSLRLKWINNLTSKEEANWKILPNYFLQNFGEDFFIFHMNLDNFKNIKIYNKSVIPDFYKDIIDTWICVNQHHFTQQNSFENIRRAVIWGNRDIKYKGQCLIFKKWISSGIFFINDIIDEFGNISEKIILTKLSDKSNWISEIHKLKLSVPPSWKSILKSYNSTQTKVKTKLTLKIGHSNESVDLNSTKNKLVYNTLLKHKFIKPYVNAYWDCYFDSKFSWKNVYKAIHLLTDNRLIQFKYKLINRIVPSKEIRFQWKLTENPLCNVCGIKETYKHLFIDCVENETFWRKVIFILKNCGIANKVKSIKNIIIGYKINQTEYSDVNTIFSLIGFSIYKSYFISESRTIKIDCFKIFQQEFQKLLTLYNFENIKLSNFELSLKDSLENLN